MRAFTIKDILRIEVAPALGCTEPAAVALCAAATKTLLDAGSVDRVELRVDPNIYKNGMGVSIPGTGGQHGIELAAALGICCGDPSRKLEVLEPVNDRAIAAAKKLVTGKKVMLHLDRKKKHLFIRCVITAGGSTAEGTIEFVHDNLLSLKLNGRPVARHPLLSRRSREKSELSRLENWLKKRTFDELIGLLESLNEEDIDFLKAGVRCNLRLAEYGLSHGCGLSVGKTLDSLADEGLLKRDIMTFARILTSSAADARMSGVKLPAMSSAGSGNHGLTALLPLWAVKEYVPAAGKRDIYAAMALSHVVTAYIKAFTGRLSAVCGCSVAAGAGAAAGIAYFMGGTNVQVAGAIKNLIGDLAGVICDGAKNSCALKLATAAGSAVQSALFSLRDIQVGEYDGIIARGTEQTMKNIGTLSTDGMAETDRTVLRIMMEKKFTIGK